MSVSKLTNVMSIHANNHTSFDRIASMTQDAYLAIPELAFDPDKTYNEYIEKRPGVYRAAINDEEYCFMIHDNLIMSDSLIVKNAHSIFELYNGLQHYLTPYKIEHNLVLMHKGYELVHTLDDPLDAVILRGKSLYTDPESFTKPGTVSHMTGCAAYTGEQAPTQIRFGGLALRSLDNVSDSLLLNRYNQRATAIRKLTEISLSGNEIIELIDERPYNQDSMVIFINIPWIKSSGKLWCTHLPVVLGDDLFSGTIGCYMDPYGKGVYMRIPRDVAGSVEAFNETCYNRYIGENPIKLVYEAKSPTYYDIVLGKATYNIPLHYGSTNIAIIPDIQTGRFNMYYNTTYSTEHENDPEFWSELYADFNICDTFFYKTLNLQ